MKEAQSIAEYCAFVTANGQYQHVTVKPSAKGDYCLWMRWCMSAVPVYRSFNGTDWVSVQDGRIVVIEYTDQDEVFYVNHQYPYGYYNPGVLREEDLPQKTDLQSRLARFKQLKSSK